MSTAVAPAHSSLSRRACFARRPVLTAAAALGTLTVLAGCAMPGYGNYSPTAGRAATPR